MNTVSPDPTASIIGRFQVRRLLGRGSQSEVYLAHDPHLDRPVAIKTLLFSAVAGRTDGVRHLLEEARTVGRISHPNVIPLYDAGEHMGHPYLVFEYVEGRTLAEVLRQEGALPPLRAVEIAIQVLDAIGCAHAQGVIHRDLKPSNIIVDGNGLARVMDFGIAAHISGDGVGGGGLMGTPAYMAPEYVRERRFGPSSDLFAVGLVLYEMLTGQPAVRGGDLPEILAKVVNEPIPAPSATSSAVDERLDDIVLKATARDPEARYPEASAMKAALERYLALPAAAEGESGAARQSTLEFLLRRMRLKSDFPALSEAVSTINRIASSDNDSVAKLSNTILKDFGLTNKLLRLVNSVSYVQYGGGSISTVSRAVVILGFNAVRNLAISLVLFENLQNKAHAAQLKEEFVRVLFAGMLARELAAKAGVKDAEEGYICAMFHNLGRMLSLFYFPEETDEIRRLMHTRGLSERHAATQVLGLSFEELGIGIAKSWGFPEQITLAMRALPEGRVRRGATNGDRLRVLADFSNALAAAIADGKPEQRAQAIASLSERFGEGLPVNARHLADVVTRSLKEVCQFSIAVNASFGQSRFARQAEKWANPAPEPPNAEIDAALTATLLADPDISANASGAATPAPTPAAVQAALLAGLQDISNSLANDELAVNDILRMILETMYRGMGFHRVLFCIKDGRYHSMHGKFGFGEGIADLVQDFRFPMASAPDVFHVALEKNVDILITDIDDPRIADHIPAWYRQRIPAKTFLIFPIVIKGRPVGMIYADKPHAGDIAIPEQVLATLKALRNQAVLAIRQSL